MLQRAAAVWQHLQQAAAAGRNRMPKMRSAFHVDRDSQLDSDKYFLASRDNHFPISLHQASEVHPLNWKPILHLKIIESFIENVSTHLCNPGLALLVANLRLW